MTLVEFLTQNGCKATPKEFVSYWEGEHSYRTLYNWAASEKKSKLKTLKAMIQMYLKDNKHHKVGK